MNPHIKEIIDSFESTSISKIGRYNDFLAYVYLTFDNRISKSKTDKMTNKYKKMRNSVLSYIVANEKVIQSEICK